MGTLGAPEGSRRGRPRFFAVFRDFGGPGGLRGAVFLPFFVIFCCFFGPKISIFPFFCRFSCFWGLRTGLGGLKTTIFCRFSSFLDIFCCFFGSKNHEFPFFCRFS